MRTNFRVFFHDYGRYAFTFDLAQELGRRGHEVAYCFSAIDSTRADEAEAQVPGLTLVPVRGGDALAKKSFFKRFQAETNHGTLAGAEIQKFRPHVVLSGNAPLEAQWRMKKSAEAVDAGFVYWMQDVLSLGARKLLKPKFGPVGDVVADHFERIEKKMVRESDGVIAIAELFGTTLREWGVDSKKINIIENWAPALAKADPADVHAWRAKHGLTDKQVLLYSGTLGMKHRPELALELAKKWKDRKDVSLVIIAEGTGIEWLRRSTTTEEFPNLILLPFQPFSMLPTTLASSDALLVLLEEDAVGYCVPSKTLTYMTAGRPILGAMPAANRAAELISQHNMGAVASPSNVDEFVGIADKLVSDPEAARVMGENAKRFADENFDLVVIADRFEKVLSSCAKA